MGAVMQTEKKLKPYEISKEWWALMDSIFCKCHYCQKKFKGQTKRWTEVGDWPPKKSKPGRSAGKTWGNFLNVYLQKDRTIIKNYYFENFFLLLKKNNPGHNVKKICSIEQSLKSIILTSNPFPIFQIQ